MDDHKLRTFNAIASFVQDLNTSFGKKYKTVALYNRLIEKTTIRDATAVDRHIAAFRKFFEHNANYIQKQTLSSDARIVYSERIYINIKSILAKTDKDAHKHIHKHIITIYSLLNLGTKQGKEALETLKKEPESPSDEMELNLPSTAEGDFVKDTITTMMDEFKDMGDNPNPMSLMTNMMQSGFIQNFFGSLQEKFSSGEMNMGSLMSTVTSVIGNSSGGGGEDAEQLRNFMSQSMGQLSNLTGGQELPADMQGQMSNLLNALGGGGGEGGGGAPSGMPDLSAMATMLGALGGGGGGAPSGGMPEQMATLLGALGGGGGGNPPPPATVASTNPAPIVEEPNDSEKDDSN